MAGTGKAGGTSVCWRWVAPAAGQVALNTHGSIFDTLLAVYTGTSVSGLATVASNDNDGGAGNTSGLYSQAQVGTETRSRSTGASTRAAHAGRIWLCATKARNASSLNAAFPVERGQYRPPVQP